MEYYNSYDPYELTHWGIKGMKWGVRRFQNKDGSLTIDGGKRYNGADYKPRKSIGEKISDHRKASKQKANLKKAREAKAAKKETEEKAKAAAEQRKKDVESGKIRAKDMTQEELNSRIERMNLEKRYQQLRLETDPSSKSVNEAKTFAKKMWDQAIVPAATEAGKEIVKKAIMDATKKKTGIKDFDIDDFWKNRNKKTTQEMMDTAKRLAAEDQIRKKMQERKDEADTAKRESEAKKQAEQQKQKAMDEYNEFQRKERESRENPKTSSSNTNSANRYNRTETHNRYDYVDPSKGPNVKNPPDVVKKTTNELSNVKTNSKEYSDKVDRGKEAAYEILDENGNVIARFGKDNKRK